MLWFTEVFSFLRKTNNTGIYLETFSMTTREENYKHLNYIVATTNFTTSLHQQMERQGIKEKKGDYCTPQTSPNPTGDRSLYTLRDAIKQLTNHIIIYIYIYIYIYSQNIANHCYENQYILHMCELTDHHHEQLKLTIAILTVNLIKYHILVKCVKLSF